MLLPRRPASIFLLILLSIVPFTDIELCADEGTPEINTPIARQRRRIDALQRIIARTTNETERIEFRERLMLEQRDLNNRLRRDAILKREQEMQTRHERHARLALHEALLSVGGDVSSLRQHVAKKREDLLKLRDTRADYQANLNRLQADAEADETEIAIQEETVRTLDERILLTSLQRDVAECEAELVETAGEIEQDLPERESIERPTVHLINARRRDVRDIEKKIRDIEAMQSSRLTQKDEISTSLDISRARLAQVNDEIALRDHRRRIDRKGAQLRIPFFGAGEEEKLKALLEERIAYQEQQLETLNRSLALLDRRKALYNKLYVVLRGEVKTLLTQYSSSVLAPILAILAVLVVYKLLSHFVLPHLYHRDRLFVARRLSGYLVVLIILCIIAAFFLEDLKDIATVLGIAGAALVIALQDLCSSFAGWFVIVASRKVRVGDRVEVDGVCGDVIDVQLLRTTLLELNNWLNIDEPTGRVIVIPNSFIFKSKVINFSHVHPYIWSRIEVTVTFETPAAKAEAVLRRILEEEARNEFDAARLAAGDMEKRYGVPDTIYEPKMFSVIAESGITYNLVYVSHYRHRTAVRNRLNARIIAEFEANTDLAFAYPTQRHIPTAKPGMLTVGITGKKAEADTTETSGLT